MKKNKNVKQVVFERMLRRRGVPKKAVSDEIGVVRETLSRLFENPTRMNGMHRAGLAKALGVEVWLIDEIINKKSRFSANDIDAILVCITSIKKQKL